MFLLVAGTALGQRGTETTVAFYNVENLFDTINDPGVDDRDFLPGGRYRWTEERFREKIEHLAGVIAGMGFPDVVGLAEVENAGVIEALTGAPQLAAARYDYFYFTSRDRRGIGVAMLYRSGRVDPLTVRPLRYRGVSTYTSRDILYVSGRLAGSDIHLLVCHLPSAGSAARYRTAAARSVRDYADSIGRTGAAVAVMGDFNMNPGSKLYRELTVGADSRTVLKNPYAGLFARGYGSYRYRERWNMYDMVLVNQALWPDGETADGGSLLRFREGNAHIFIRDHLIQTGGRWAGYPFRSYSGSHYIGGYSDHLPVYLVIRKE
ncbi:MAG: endonuclease/exonuclease/phosphatase family protein [Rikenellaceae bacterium]|nr:endonuclease/exonuclease/phosphatase family protein [Rikenellaceae bacterium]